MRILRIVAVLFFIPFCSICQIEICNNGLDDDNDSLVDCYDNECLSDPLCVNFFIKDYSDTACFSGTGNNVFNLQKLWTSAASAETRQTVAVGDIDGDGVPEIIAFDSQTANQLYIIDGITGATKNTFACPAISTYNGGAAIGDIDRDGFAEIFLVTGDGFLHCFNNSGVSIWTSTVKVGSSGVNAGYRRPALADFNEDGNVEVYVGNKIFNAATGALIAVGASSNGGQTPNLEAMSVAADVLPASACIECSGLELVCGNEVYGIDFTADTMYVRATAPNSRTDGYTSVADLNNDGKLDIVVVPYGEVYAWNPISPETELGYLNLPVSFGGGGPANIGNYDNDPELEIGIAGVQYVAIDNDISTIIWQHELADLSSITSSTSFDFDGDGKLEIVTRDEDSLFIFNCVDGTVLAQTPCGSGTRFETPVIADVDGDCHANIVCVCASAGGSNAASGKIISWTSASNEWANTRRVYNQHPYFSVNINDDLTLPIQQQNHANLSLPSNVNRFLGQQALIDENGKATCSVSAEVSADVTICSGTQVTLTAMGSGHSISEYSWSNGVIGSSLIQVSPAVTSDYTVTVKEGNCSITKMINAYVSSIDAIFSTDNDSGPPPLNINFDNSSVNGLTYKWYFGDGDSSSTFEPSKVYDALGDYTVTLYATNEIGCVDSASYSIKVVDNVSSIYIPNAFTPNGDNLNDVFQVVSRNIKAITVRIFDRWGKELYRTASATSHWDGTYYGRNLQQDSYVVRVDYTTIENKEGKVFGSTFLIR